MRESGGWLAAPRSAHDDVDDDDGDDGDDGDDDDHPHDGPWESLVDDLLLLAPHDPILLPTHTHFLHPTVSIGVVNVSYFKLIHISTNDKKTASL